MTNTVRCILCQTEQNLSITKHKKAVDELRQRRAKGESGLIIPNGLVTIRQATPVTMQDPLNLMFEMTVSLPDDGFNVIEPCIDQPNLDSELNLQTLFTRNQHRPNNNY